MSSSVEELIRNVETVWTKSNDVVQVFAPFCTLVDAVLDSREKKHLNVLEDFFAQIESGLNLKKLKDAEKVQKRLDFYRIMLKVYESETFGNLHAAFDCYNKIICKTIVTITSRNIHKHLDHLSEDFEAAWKIVMKNRELELRFWDTLKLILNRYESQYLTKDLKVYDKVLGAKAQHLFAIGYWQDALATVKDRFLSLDEYISSITEWPDTYFFFDLAKLWYSDFKSYWRYFWPVLKSYANGTAFRNHEQLNRINEKFENGKALFSQERFLEANEMFKLALRMIPKEDPPTLVMKYNTMKVLVWHSKCECRIGNHLDAIKYVMTSLEFIQHCCKHFKCCDVSAELGFDAEDIFEVLLLGAKCLFRDGYDDEALEFAEMAMKYVDKPHPQLSKIYAQIMICSNKLKKVSNQDALDDDQAALFYYLSKNMEKADKILLYSTKSSKLMNFIQVQRWREKGCTEWAIELCEMDKGLHVNPVTYALMYLEIGQNHVFNDTVNDLVNAKENYLEELTKACLENFNPRDSIKFQKYLVKSLKRKSVTKMYKKAKKELGKWSNSISISLLVQKKLKRKWLREPFLLFENE